MEIPRENVQSYPRPPLIEAVPHRLTIHLGGALVADTTRAWRICETHHAPTYYLPPEHVKARLTPCAGSSFCEWKGRARYYDVTAGGVTARRAAWAYDAPVPRYAALAGHLAFYPGLMERCSVAGLEVIPQPGDFYGGWVTPNLDGIVKGGPGTRGW